MGGVINLSIAKLLICLKILTLTQKMKVKHFFFNKNKFKNQNLSMELKKIATELF